MIGVVALVSIILADDHQHAFRKGSYGNYRQCIASAGRAIDVESMSLPIMTRSVQKSCIEYEKSDRAGERALNELDAAADQMLLENAAHKSKGFKAAKTEALEDARLDWIARGGK